MFSSARGGNQGSVSSAREVSRLLRIGCSGWNYPHWRAGVSILRASLNAHWLTYYAERFDTVELNTTFYRLPQAASVARWVSETPLGFTFAVKVSRYITHIKRLTQVSTHLSLLYERIEPLLQSPKLGPLLWQLPPNFRYDPDRLEEHPRASARWSSTCLRIPASLLVSRRDVLAVARAQRRPGDCRPPLREHLPDSRVTTDYTYVRFHGGTRGGNGNYSRSELTEWAGRLDRWSKTVDVFAYFNNDWEGYAIDNANVLRNIQPMTSRAEPASAPAVGRRMPNPSTPLV